MNFAKKQEICRALPLEQIREGEDAYFIADPALYTQNTITTISESMKWVTRVPEILSEAKKVIQYADPLENLEPGYAGKEFISEYGGVQ